jgi:UDP-2-acetamido-3-amino-2,3-dideoxy-glucuronate N-acetyltransferase
MRGSFMALELESQLPFVPRCFFCVYGVPSRKVRGQHAHRECHQYLVALAGSASYLVDDGVSRRTVTLNDAGTGLHTAHDVEHAVRLQPGRRSCGVRLAPHDADDYIRHYQEFVSVAGGSAGV